MGKFSGAAKAGFAVAGLAALKFGADSLKAFSEAQQVAAQTDAVIKSTGGSANVTADQVSGLATEIRNLSGIDDEAVQASENLLLTFRDIHNAAGEGNDIFDQTTRAIADMATAMNQGAIPSQEQLAQTTIQVGKAMNDPIKGMTALRRVGVAFTDSQVATITSLQKSGDLMGAQKIILGELTAEFGGAAEAAGNTFAGSMAKAKGKVDDLEESVGALGASLVLAFTGDYAGAASLWVDTVSDPKTNEALYQLATTTTLNASKQKELTAEVLANADALGLSKEQVQAYVGAINTLTPAQVAARTEMQHTVGAAAALDVAQAAVQSSAAQAAFADQGLADAMRDLNDALRESWSLANQAAGGLVGLAAADADAEQSQRDLAAAQQTVNQLATQGKKGTVEYKDAVLARNAAEIQSIQSQQNLEGQAQSLYAEFKKGNVTLAEADRRLRAQADAAGLSAGRTNDLVAKVNALYQADSKMPKDVVTNFSAPGLDAQMSQLVAYWTKLTTLPTHRDVTITTTYRTVGSPGSGGGATE
jgi:hypothetical protein